MQAQLEALRAALVCNDLNALRAVAPVVKIGGDVKDVSTKDEIEIDADDDNKSSDDDDQIEDETDDVVIGASKDQDDDDAVDSELDDFVVKNETNDDDEDASSGDENSSSSGEDASSSSDATSSSDDDEDDNDDGGAVLVLNGDAGAEGAKDVDLDEESRRSVNAVYARGQRLRSDPVTVEQARSHEQALRRRFMAASLDLRRFRDALSLTQEYSIPVRILGDFNAERRTMTTRTDQELLADWIVTRIAPALRANYFALLVATLQTGHNEQALEALHVVTLCAQVGNWLMAIQYQIDARLNNASRTPHSTLARFREITRELGGAATFRSEEHDASNMQCALTRETVPNGSGRCVFLSCFYVDTTRREVATRELCYFVHVDYVSLFYAWFVLARLPELISASAQHEIIKLLTPRLRQAYEASEAAAFALPTTAAEACLTLDWSIPRASALLTAPSSDWTQGWLNTIYTALFYAKESLLVTPECSIGQLILNDMENGN